MAVAALLKAGDQVPVIPFVEVAGSGSGAPGHTEIALKVGVTKGVTVTVNVVVEAHCPALGVNVYVAVAALLKAGDQVPVMLLDEVVGSGSAAPAQTVIGLKVGVTVGLTFTTTVSVMVLPQLLVTDNVRVILPVAVPAKV